jgi:two-component system, NarL family, nitrate/nitrite response regulator NarL
MLRKSDRDAIRILLVDDHEIFLGGLMSLLRDEPGMIVVGQARNKTEALEAARLQPDIILLDLDLGAESGPTFIPDLIKVAQGARILALTGLPDADLHLQAVCRGALGVVFKSQAPHLLLSAIRKVHAGEAWLNRTMVATAMTQLQVCRPKKADPDSARIHSLTARELEIIAAVAEGRRNKGVGEQLFISEKTVRHYLTSIYDKLGVTGRLGLMIFAYKHGLTTVPSGQSSQTGAFPD